jgi:hypothetical protein
MLAVRATAVLISALALLAGCGQDKPGNTAATTAKPKPPTQTATTPAAKPPKQEPRYVPSAHHAHRPPGSVYDDEIGENVVSAPYRRVIELFGQPASRHGKCIRYRIVGMPRQQWEFCFKGQTMTGAMVIPR